MCFRHPFIYYYAKLRPTNPNLYHFHNFLKKFVGTGIKMSLFSAIYTKWHVSLSFLELVQIVRKLEYENFYWQVHSSNSHHLSSNQLEIFLIFKISTRKPNVIEFTKLLQFSPNISLVVQKRWNIPPNFISKLT